MKHRRTAIDMERKLAQVLLDVGAALPDRASPSRAPGDERKLRGIPVVGVRGGFGGAIAGTRPGDGLERSMYDRSA